MLSDTSRFFFCVWKWRFFSFRLVLPFLENVMPRKICRPIETSIDVDFFSSFRWSITISIRSINLDGIKIHLHCELSTELRARGWRTTLISISSFYRKLLCIIDVPMDLKKRSIQSDWKICNIDENLIIIMSLSFITKKENLFTEREWESYYRK